MGFCALLFDDEKKEKKLSFQKILLSNLDRFVLFFFRFLHSTQTSKLVSNVQGQCGLRVVIIVDNDQCGNDGWLANHKLRLFSFSCCCNNLAGFSFRGQQTAN